MKRNVGERERYGRLGLGVLSGAGAIFLPVGTVVQVLLGVVAVAGLATGTSRYCPINQAFGIDNYGKGERTKEVSKTGHAA